MRVKPAALLILGIAIAATAGPAASAETIAVPARVDIRKPLALTAIQNFNLGNVVLAPGTWSEAVVRLSRAGVLTCPASLTCFGATQVARYRVSGGNRETIRINTPNVTLVNQSDPSKTLILVVDSPGTVRLPNSGSQGVIFPLGGSVSLNSTTADGTYVGTFNVSVEYQ